MRSGGKPALKGIPDGLLVLCDLCVKKVISLFET